MGSRRRTASIVIRRAAVAAATVLATLATMYGLTHERAPEVAVGWPNAMPAERREQLERQFALARARQSDGRFTYDLLDLRPANVRALVEHADVEDTHEIDRQNFTVPADSPYGRGPMWIGDRLPVLRVRGVVPLLAAVSGGVLGVWVVSGAYRGRKRLRRLLMVGLRIGSRRIEKPRQRFAGGGDVGT